ncbi:NUDIX hydrolase [Leucobacter allii]|uniref:NUDIX domain-containing protein n=1 Tax=Leucobacter allii TaxID=2932247 RepID=UPI001FCF94C7|nr:NUDIX hydrolase [Leucobacter allii]UOR02331.1 NUDIX hydrolase [Leucobacter allii]
MSDLRNPGDAWVTAADGGRYWGRFGAAGLLAHDRERDAILLQHRVTWSDHGDTWGIPGGARHEGESAIAGALRESQEEAGVPDGAVLPRYTHLLDRGGWSYTTLIAEVVAPFEPEITDPESHALAWVPVDEVAAYPLHPAFAASWDLLRPLLGAAPAVVVDAANVIGSVPDGWWKDRRGAAERLRDRIAAFVRSGNSVRSGFFELAESRVAGLDRAFPEWTLVVEGPANGIASVPGVRVVDAPVLGDDTIVEQVAALTAAGRTTIAVTSDVELKARARVAGAVSTRGVRKLLRLLPQAAEAR